MSLTPSPAILSIAVALLSLSQILLLFRFNALERKLQRLSGRVSRPPRP
jgi:hypothetical protein